MKNVKRLALALCLATPVVSWAAEPIAEWGPGDFPVSARGTNAVTDEQSGVTISKNNLNNTSTSGYIAVSETGNDSGWPITLSGNYSALTVVVAYQLSSSASGSIIALANANGSGRVNANIQDGNLYGGQGAATTHDLGFSSPANEGVVHTLAMAYSPSDGTAFYFDGVKSETDCSGFKEDGNVTEVCLGAYRGPNNIIKGIRYYYVAVYDSKLGDDDAVAACASALDGFVTVSSSGVALDAATYNDKDVTFVGEEGGYLTVDESIALSSLTAAGKPLTIKVNPGATLSAESINAVDTTVDLSGWDLTAFARNAVVGAPYRIWPILSPSATGSITYDTTGATIPSGYTATTVQTAIGPALEFTTELQFGSLSINFCGTYYGVNQSGARVSDNASYSGLNHGAFPVIGTSWNDVPGQNASGVAIPTYIDNLGDVHTDGTASVSLSQVDNAWDTNSNAGDRILFGYCDDGGSPVVTISNIPFNKFRVIAYAATDTANTTFSPKTINGVVYSTGAAGSTATPTLSGRPDNVGWGASSSRSQLLEGVNYLVSDVIRDTTTVTINNPKNVGRAGIPAVQIVEVGVEYAVERKNFDDGDKYTIDSLIDANSVVVTCDGSITIEGTENYTVTERDLEIMDFSGVEGTVTLGEHTQITLGADRQLPAEYNFGTGSTVAIAETSEEYGKDMFSVAGLTGVSYVKLLHRDITLTVTDGVASYGDGTDVKIDGAATMYDATFTNTTAFAYKNSSGAAIGLDTAVNPKYNNDLNDETTGIYIRHHPYVNGAASDIYGLSDFTVLVVGQMSPTHKTQFIHLGSTANTTYTGLLIATTENDDEVIIAPNTGKLVDTSNAVTVSVPNAANARHAYVITKVGNTFTVSVDGIRRGNFTVANGWTIGVSTHSGVQVGSDFGGEIQRDTSNPDRFMAVANSTDETGVVNVIRVFDYAISEAQAEAVVAAYPYVSEGGLYTRTVEGDVDFAAAGAWAKDGDAETYLYPQGATVEEVYYNPSATITVAEESTMSVNASIGLDKLTVGGKSQLTFAGSSDSVKVYGAAIINSPVVVEYGALDLSGAPVQLGSDGSVTFNCLQFDVSSVYETRRFQLTGVVDQDDERITFVNPAGDSYRTVTFGYNAIGHVYEFVVTPDHEAGSDVYYKSGYFGKGGQDEFKVVLSDGTTETAVFPDDAVVIDDKSTQNEIYVGELPDNVEAIKVNRDVILASGDANNEMLADATVTVGDECTLTIQRNWNDIVLGDVEFNGSGVVLDSNGGTITVSGSITGTSTLTVKEDTAVTVDATGSVANAIVLEAGATLTVPATSQITSTTFVDNCTVTSTVNGDTKVWSVVEERCSIAVTCGENGSIDISYYDTSSSTWLAAEGDSVPKGAVIKVSVTPDLGYKIDFVEVYMGGLDITESIETEETGNVTTATLEITDDTTIAITFEIKAVSFTVEAVANTTVKVMEGYTQIYPDKDGVYTVQPQAFVTVSWEADGNFVVTNGQKEWFTPTAGQVIAAPEEISVVPAVAKVTTSQTDKLYATLQEALENATLNDTVTLLDDVTVTSTITIDTANTYTIDLNGNNIEAVDCRAIWLKSGYITITGEGTISATADEDNDATVFSEDSSVIRVGGTSSSSAFLTLGEDVTVETDYCYGITYFGNGGQTVIINGTVETTSDRPAISGNGLSSGSTMLTVGVTATISSTKTYAIYNPQSGTTSIYGTIVGVGGIEAKSGLVYVYSGASVTATAEAQSHDPSGNGTSTTGYAIASLYCGGNYNGAGNVTVDDGAVVSGKVVTFQDGGASMTPATLTVAPSVAEMVAIEDNQYWDNLMVTSVSLKDKPTVAVVDGVEYWDFDTALAAAVAGNKTLTLEADLAITETIEINGSMTLDLNNYKITATGCRAIWVKAGTVVINGGDMNMGTIKATGITDDGKSIIRVGSDIAETDFTLARGVTVCNEMGDNFYGITYFGTKPQTVTISGYVQVYGSQPALSGNGLATYADTTLVVDGSIQAWGNNLGIYNPQSGTTVIRKNGENLGGMVNGGIEVKSGTVTIEEGVSVTSAAIAKAHEPCSDGPSTAGYGIAVVDNASYKDHPPVVNVKFGTSAMTYVSSMIVLSENNSTTVGQLNIKCEESQLSSITIADGLEWKEIVGEYNYTLKVIVPGLDPTDPESTQEVVVDPAGKTEAEIAEEVIESATVAVPETVANLVDAGTYKTYFNYTVTPSMTKPNTYEVAVALVNDLKEEVVLPEEVKVGEETITQAEELLEAATSEFLSAMVPAVPGIYYSMVVADNPNFDGAEEGIQTLAMANTVIITKPANMPTGKAVFFRVKASATPNTNNN